MRTSRLRALAVIAGFIGVSMLVAGTASATIAGQVESPIATAVKLHQEDPASQTAPVPAELDPAAPVEVGSGLIECDDDGICASLIKVRANKQDPLNEPAPAGPVTTRGTGNQSQYVSGGEIPDQADTDLPKTSRTPAEDRDSRRARGDHGRGEQGWWNTDGWDPGGHWYGQWDHTWPKGWADKWSSELWNKGHWDNDR